jgi:hypothetical protein
MPFDISQREMILIAVIGGLVLVCIYMYKTKEKSVAPEPPALQKIEPKKVVCDENSCYVSESSSGVELETEEGEEEEEEEDNSIDIVEGEGEGEEEKEEEVDPPITISD